MAFVLRILIIHKNNSFINAAAHKYYSITYDTPDPLESPAQKLTPISTSSPTDDQESYNMKPTETMSFYSIETQGTHGLDSTETRGMDSWGTNTEYVISIGLLATALMVCIVVFIIVISIILIRSKAKLEAAVQQSASPGETIHVEPIYEDITGPLPSESAIDIQDNVAYGHGHTQTITAT